MKRKFLVLNHLIGVVSGLVIGFGVALTSHAAVAGESCEQIRAACEAAGFVRGGVKTGKGLQVDCLEPIMQGTALPQQGGIVLPQIDPKVVAACKAAAPSYGQRNNLPSATNAQAAPTVSAQSAAPSARLSARGCPNVVFILTDDLAWKLVQYMPHVLKMQKDGVIFVNYFVNDSLCSRRSGIAMDARAAAKRSGLFKERRRNKSFFGGNRNSSIKKRELYRNPSVTLLILPRTWITDLPTVAQAFNFRCELSDHAQYGNQLHESDACRRTKWHERDGVVG